MNIAATHRTLGVLVAVLLAGTAGAQMRAAPSKECALPEVPQAWSRPAASMPTFFDTTGADQAGSIGQPYRVRLEACRSAQCKPGQFYGLYPIRVIAPGRYRVAVDVPVWIDVVTRAGLAEGLMCEHVGCDPIRKIMQFELQPGVQWVALSTGMAAEIGFVVLPVRD